jgi:hypothetical protein
MGRFSDHQVKRSITQFDMDGTIREQTLVPLSDLTDKTLPKLIEALGGREAFEALPVLNLDTCTGRDGHTGYIDFVRPGDMADPIMRGECEDGRPFVAFRLSRKVTDYESPNWPEDTVEKVFVETLFRRYPEGSVWASGGSSSICSSRVGAEALRSVKSLASTGRAIREDEDGDFSRVDLSR